MLLKIEVGKPVACELRQAAPGEWGIVKAASTARGNFDESENMAVPAGRQIDTTYEIGPGDILVSCAAENCVGYPVLVGRCRRQLLLSDEIMRLVPSGLVNKEWLVHFLRSPQIRGATFETETGSDDSARNISQQALLDASIPLPPLAEQARIVEALEAQLSRLDAATKTIRRSLRRLAILRRSILLSLVPEGPPAGWVSTTVERAGEVRRGRVLHARSRGPGMRPCLRVENISEDCIDASDVTEIDLSESFEEHILHSGDVLIGGEWSPNRVGTPALYRGMPPDAAFADSLLRFRARADVLPEWALMVFRRHLHAKRFLREVDVTADVARISLERLKRMEFLIPPMGVQKRLVQRCDELLSGVDAMSAEAEISLVRAAGLRSAILNRAFTGGLVPQDPADAPAADLLARIQAERADQPGTKRARRAKRPSAPEPTTATAVQQEFEL
ncbi:restriction endonuclease subunit S [Streptomyces sp. NPDC014623]|uniref:restriction endonuclease subunit S n=1 Tax=Streptomyces sp. NPDC014623 TaxID=3364875 RepID=UPI0036F6304C